MTPIAFVNDVIGLPYEAEGLHCWALCHRAQREVFGREVVAVMARPEGKRDMIRLMAQRHEYAGWREAAGPEHGAIVFMTRAGHGPSKAACHAGVYLDLDGGGVLHTDDPHGVVFESIPELRARNWADLTFFVPA